MTQGRKGESDNITPFGVQRPDKLEPPARWAEQAPALGSGGKSGRAAIVERVYYTRDGD